MYNQYLDFGVIKKALKEQEKLNAVSDPLRDMDDIPDEVVKFFNDVLNAGDTDALSGYSDKLLHDAEDLLLGTDRILSYISNRIHDNSLFSQKNRQHLTQQIKARRCISRRVL